MKRIFSEELLKDEYQNLAKIKVIYGSTHDLAELNRVCQIYYENPEELSVADKEHLDGVEGTFLHEVYHCLKMPKTPKSVECAFITTTLGLVPATISYIAASFVKEPLYKKYASKTLKGLGVAWLASYVLLIGSTVSNMRQNEYEADMHAIKHGTHETIQAVISQYKEEDKFNEALGWKILNPAIKKLESLQEKSWNITKPLYAATAKVLKNAQDIYVEPTHPSLETRIKYFSEALEKAKR